MSDELKLGNLTSHEISLMKDDKLREKIKLDEQHKIILQEIIHLMHEMDKIRLKKRELEDSKIQNEFLIKKINSELKLLDSAFWSAKQSGI